MHRPVGGTGPGLSWRLSGGRVAGDAERASARAACDKEHTGRGERFVLNIEFVDVLVLYPARFGA